jgi:hypothetical protein
MTDSSPAVADMHKRIASRCNDAAWTLIEKPNLAVSECAALVRLAATASYHWGEIGTARNVARADLLFAWALARAGAAPPAVDAASRALKYFTENQSQDWEHAFAHAAMAASLHCAGDQDGHRQHFDEAEKLGSTLAPGDLKLFQAAFRNVPQVET